MKINTKVLLNELYKAFALINKTYYNNKLPEAAITIQGNGNRTNVMGWCTVNKVWQDTINNEQKYEIAIIGEYLNRGMFPVISTLMHEMVHLHNLVNGIVDVSRNGTYHNKKFKNVAESHGLIIEHIEKIGWSKTNLTESTIQLLKKSELNENAFSLIRLAPEHFTNGESEVETKSKSRSKSLKYVCPICGNSVRANKEMSLICGEDGAKFELEN
ncbi:hypothetical protein FDC58_14830 [Clostridium botulinum]|nr:SprT-like domain-containing protein [Clostridium botulinum]MBY7009297.1 SprT-like domain-containing protein [Clostridium botulinum]NFF03781.1 hypothetical protein [Clostridium botulinum]NFH74286.1 hypothetical protein [Clostridium botulinum]NFI02345.1 hypothetical protein [Clostridium botulinum]NFI57898.1 hypothetical protein [Clostridium botulinum]